MIRYIYVMCLAIGLSTMLLGASACNPPTVDNGEEPVSTIESASTFDQCGGCPGGTFATGFFCNLNCGSCINGNNASHCTTAPSCGAFDICGTSCPSGFATSRFFCNLNCGSCINGNNAATCTNIAQQCCPCAPFQVGSTNDRGAFNGQHFVELFFSNFTSSNPSIGTARAAACSCSVSFTIGQIFCNGAPTSATLTFSNNNQINIAIPTSSVSRNCVAFSSSTNTQFIQFNFTTPPD